MKVLLVSTLFIFLAACSSVSPISKGEKTYVSEKGHSFVLDQGESIALSKCGGEISYVKRYGRVTFQINNISKCDVFENLVSKKITYLGVVGRKFASKKLTTHKVSYGLKGLPSKPYLGETQKYLSIKIQSKDKETFEEVTIFP